MMKRFLFLTFAFFFAVFFGGTAWGQSPLTVCDGDEDDDTVPVNFTWADTDGTTSEFIMPADLLSSMNGKDITGMSFYSGSTSVQTGATFQVYMKEVTNTTISAITGPASCTIVYTGYLNVNGSVLSISFDDVYKYNGGNLLVGTKVISHGTYSGAGFIGVQAQEGASFYYYYYDGDVAEVKDFLPKTTFIYETPSTCPKPTGISVNDITSSSATISWTENGEATEWILQVSTDNVFETDTDEYTVETSPSKNVDLDENTVYYARVKASCDENHDSAWSSIVSFQSECLASLPYEYGFEEASELDCWTMVDCASGTGIKTSVHYTGSHSFAFEHNTTPPQYLISPEFEGAGGILVSFSYMNYDDTEYFRVGYSTTTNAIDQFTWGDLITADTQLWSLFEHSYPDGTKYIAIKYESNDQYYLILDDFYFVVPNQCSRPTNVEAYDLTERSAKVRWESEENEFKIEYRKSGQSSWVELEDVITNKYYTIENLAIETQYEVRVKTICSELSQSAWSPTMVFTTNALQPEQVNFSHPEFVDDFESSINWRFVNGSYINTWEWGTGAHNGDGSTKSIYISNDLGISNKYTTTDELITVYASKTFSLLANSYIFTYDWKVNGHSIYNGSKYLACDYLLVALAPANSEVSTIRPYSVDGLPEGWISLTSDGSFMGTGLLFTDKGSQGEGNSEFHEMSITRDVPISGDYKVILMWHNDSSTTHNDPAAVDNFKIEMVIKPADLVVNDITLTSAVVRWNEGGETNCDLQYRIAGGAWSDIINLSEHTYTINDLEPGTTYEVQVKFANGTDWASRTFATPICDDEDKCEINYELTDSYGDGWTGNAIQLVDFYTNEVITTLTISDGNTLSGSYSMCNGRKIKFIWVSGNWGEECGFTITDPVGNDIVSHSVGTEPEEGELAVYTHYCNPTFITDGNWNVASNWSYGVVPTSTDDVVINAECTIPSTCIAQANTITLDGGSITIADGGQLICNNSVQAKVQKNITAAVDPSSKDGEAPFGWYSISSPVNNAKIDGENANTNLITPTAYDLYRYNETLDDLQWENYRQEGGVPGFTTMDNGRGYLYRNAEDLTIEFTGAINNGDIVYPITNTDGSGDLAGFNLIGNPFTHDIYKGTDGAIDSDKLIDGFYIATNSGEWHPCIDNTTPIERNQGVLVQATETFSLTIKDVTTGGSGAKANNDNIKFMVANSQYEDVTYAVFDKGTGLNKINHRNAAVPMLYIPQDGVNYAIATMSDGTKTFNLNFKAMTMGKYTLKYKTQGQYSYLHVIDRLTGNDVDMLMEGEYSFIGSPSDADNRFIVKLNYEGGSASEGDIFAYQSGGDIVVSGEGELQVFDLMGRMVMTQRVNGVQNISVKAQGVYVFKLNGMTQKIVVK